MPATILNGSTTQSAGLNINLSLLKGGTISQTIVGAIITALVIASTVATIILVSVGVGFTSPQPQADFATTYKRVPITIDVLLNDKDPRGGNLTLTQIVDQPKFGTVKISSRSQVVYQSIGAFTGNDTFSYEVSNSFVTANATVTVQVLNRPPQAVPIYKKVSKNAKKALVDIFNYIGDNDERISDIDDDTLYVVAFSDQVVTSGNAASLGAIEIDAYNGFLYTPVTGFNGIEQFKYSISDGNDTASSTVTVEVENDPPTANDDIYRIPKYSSLELFILQNDYDINGDDFNISSSIGAAYGSLRVQDKSVVYYTSSTLKKKYIDSFEYTISDGQKEGSAIVSVSVYNTEPTVYSKNVTIGKSSSNNLIPIEFSDPDGKDVVVLKLITPALSSLNPAATLQTAKGVKRVLLDCCDWVSVETNNYTIVFTPTPGVVYSQSLDISVSDDEADGYGRITINVVNNPPVAVEDSADCNKNQQVLINVLANDYDVNPGDTELLQLTTNGFQSTTTNGGTVSIYNATHILYVAPKGSLLPDVAYYRIFDQSKDAQGNPDSTGYSTGKININIVNNPPVPVDDVFKISKGLNATLDVLINDYDPNSDIVTTINSVDRSTVKNILASIVKNSGSKDTLFYPAANEEYTDYLTYDVTDVDGLVSETKATVTLNVVNDAPVANDDTYSVNWNHNILCPVKVNDADINGDLPSSKIEIYQNPANGAVEVVGDNVRYTPTPTFVGVDTFQYKLNDGSVENPLSNAATVTINVLNTAPIAVDDSATTHWRNDAGVLVSVLVNDSDNEGDSLSVTNAQADASAGTASVFDSQTVKFVPTQTSATVGTKQIKYTVSDGNKNTIGNVNVQVTNTKPVATADSYTFHWAAPKQTLSVMSNDADADVDPISIKTVTSTSGAAVKNGDVIDYTPKKDGVKDTFQYVITDTVTDADPATVTVTFTNNDQPTASSVSTSIHWRAFAAQSNQQDFSVYSSNTDSDGDTVSLTVNPTATGIAGASCEKTSDAVPKVLVKAPTKTLGSAACSFSISDGLATTGTKSATVTITNSAPKCNDITVFFNAIYVQVGQTFSVSSSVSDADPADVPYLAASSAILSGAYSGDVFSVSSGSLLFKPNGQLGNRVYGYKVSDGIVESSQCKFTIIVSSLSNADYSQAYDVHWNVTKAFLNITSKLTTSTIMGIVEQPSQGTAYFEGGKIYFTPARKIYLDSFIVSVKDGITSNVSVSVSTYNNAPTASVATINVNWGKTAVIDLLQNYVDADYSAGREIKGTIYSIDKTGLLGSVSALSGSSVTYTTPPSYVGSDSFKATATDGLAFVTFIININVINTAPVTNAKTFNVHWAVHKTGYSMNLATSVTDGQNDPLTFGVVAGSVSPSSAGSVVISTSPNAVATAGSSVYLGKFTYSYTASDSLLTSAGTATVTVYNNMATPVADSKSVHWRATNVPLNPFAKFAATYKDGDGDNLTIQTATAQKGSVSIVAGSQSLLYSAPTNPPALGNDVVTYKFTDGAESLQNAATIVNVNVYNTVPTAKNQVVYGKWNSPVVVSLSNACSDVDTLDIPYVAFNGVISNVAGGSTSISGTTVTFTPTVSSLVFTQVSTGLYNATASFKFQCNDGISTSTGNVTIIISNNAPTGVGKTVNINRDYLKPTYDFTWNQIATYANPDVDGDAVQITNLVSVDTTITVSNIGTGIRLNTPKTVSGSKQITFLLYDGLHYSSKLTFTVNFINNGPSCGAVSTIYLNKKGKVDLSTYFSGTDTNNDPLTYNLVGPTPTGLGTLSGKVFTASATATGTVSFTYSATDSQLTSSPCSIQIIIQNSSPSASDTIFYIYPAADSLAHYFSYKATDADGDTITYTAGANNCSSLSTGVSINSASGSITFKRIYTVISGTCQMAVTVSDNNTPAGTSTVKITFVIIPRDPVARDDRFSIPQGQTIRIFASQILANDNDELGTSSTLTLVNISCPDATYCHRTPVRVTVNDEDAIEVDSDQSTCQADKFRYTMKTALGAYRSADVYIEFKNCYCTAKIDFVFLLDSSQSITTPNFDKIRDLCKKITGRMKLSDDSIKVAIVRFHTSATLTLPLSTDGAKINRTLTTMYYDSGMTAQVPGLRAAVDALRPENGGRADADKVIYILTDGLANIPCSCGACESEWGTTPSVFQDSVERKIINGMSGWTRSQALQNICKYQYNGDGSVLDGTDCNDCEFKAEQMCLPCSDAIPVASKINTWKRNSNGVVPNDPDNPYNGNNRVQWKVVAMAVGEAMDNVWGARQIEGMNYDPTRAITVSWTDLSDTMSEIVDQSCNQVNVQVPV